MAKQNLTIPITVQQRWWLPPYLFGVRLTSLALGVQPDWVRVERVIKKGLVTKVKRG